MQKWYKMGPYQLKTMLVYNPLIDGDFWMGNSNYNPKKRSFFGGVLGPYLKQAAGPICPDLSPLSHYEPFRDIGQQKGDLSSQLLAFLGEKIR